MNLVLLTSLIEDFTFPERKKEVCVCYRLQQNLSSYRSMNCHYGVHSAIRSFSKFYRGASIFEKPKLLAEFKVGLSEMVLAQGFLLIHKYFSTETMQDEKLLILRRFLSTKIPLPGLVRTRRGIAVRRSDLVNLWICSRTFSKVSIFLCEYNPSSVIVFKSLFLSCDVKLGGNEVITLRYKQIGQNRR